MVAVGLGISPIMMARVNRPVIVPLLSTLFAVGSLVGGILLALGGSVPISPYVTTISFTIYVVCRIAGRRGVRRRRSPALAGAGV